MFKSKNMWTVPKGETNKGTEQIAGMDGEAIFVYGTGRGGEPPLPHSAGRGGEGVKICGAGRGWGGEHTACISWLKSYAAEKEILICIALSEVNLLNINNLDRNHN